MLKNFYLVLLAAIVIQTLFCSSGKPEIAFYENQSNIQRTRIIEQFINRAEADTVFEVIDNFIFVELEYTMDEVDIYVVIDTKIIQDSVSAYSSLISTATVFFQGKYMDTVINTSKLEDYQLHSNSVYNLLVDKNSNLFKLIVEEKYNIAQQSVRYELEMCASQVLQFWKTPVSQGGAGQKESELTRENLSVFIGFDTIWSNPDDDIYALTTDNGEFRVISCTGSTVVLKGMGFIPDKDGNYQIETATIELHNQVTRFQKSTGKSF